MKIWQALATSQSATAADGAMRALGGRDGEMRSTPEQMREFRKRVQDAAYAPGCAVPCGSDTVAVEGILLVREGGEADPGVAVVKIQFGGKLIEIMREGHDGSYSHFVHPEGMRVAIQKQAVEDYWDNY